VVAPAGQTSNYVPDFTDLSVSFNYAKGERFGADRMTGMQMYYKKPTGGGATDEGYLLVASATPIELVRMMDKGYQPLRLFGEFQLWNPNENWRVPYEPYRRIFQRPGGINLFPLAQIIEHHWHIVPPYAGIEFPQLRGLDVAAYTLRCTQCRQFFTSEELLAKHHSVGHRQTAQNTALGQEIAKAIATMNAPIQNAMTPMLDAIAKQMAGFQVIVEGLNLSQREQQRINDLLLSRAGYGGHLGVPAAPPEPAEIDPNEPPAEPVAASEVTVPPMNQRRASAVTRQRDPKTGRLLPKGVTRG
jgi:hypothetical protein